MTGAFADHIKLPFEVISLKPIGRADKELHDVRLCRTSRRTDISGIGFRRHFAPAKALLTLFGNNGVHDRDALLPLGFVLGQENQPRAKPPFLGQIHAEVLLGHRSQETFGQSNQNPRAIAGIRLTPATAAMLHIAQHFQRIEHVLVARRALQVGHKTNAAAVFFISRVIEALLLRKTNGCFFAHFSCHMARKTP